VGFLRRGKGAAGARGAVMTGRRLGAKHWGSTAQAGGTGWVAGGVLLVRETETEPRGREQGFWKGRRWER